MWRIPGPSHCLRQPYLPFSLSVAVERLGKNAYQNRMGQSASTDITSAHRTVGNTELVALFAQQCARGLQPIELMALKRSLSAVQKTLTSTSTTGKDIITETDFQTLLQLPDEHPHIRHLLFSITSKLSQFPLLAHSQTPLTTHGLLTALTLLNKERCNKVLGGQADYVKLMFVALATESSRMSPVHTADTQTVIYQRPGVISWSDTLAVKTFDGLNFEQMTIPADDLLTVFASLMALVRLHPTHSLKQYTFQLSQLSNYKKHALPILRAMNSEITGHNLKEKTVTYSQFTSTIESVAPHILNPLTSILETLLYDHDMDETSTSHPDDDAHHSRLIDPFSLAQLSTYFEPDLIHANIRKLYIGRDSGFSMRSFESKVFKWNAPSFLFLKGTRVTKYKASKNPRYKKFEERYPRLPSSSTALNVPDKEEAITYAVYVDTPWKVSNKETFGTANTVIFQLTPVQRVFTGSISAKHFIYFSTLGGGIGIGSQLATIKGNNELVRYNPGNVSLTIDSSLEFAVFRNLGLGGEFRSMSGVSDQDAFEDRFMISDVEVWGCGGAKELEEQNKRWEWEQAEAKRRQNINLKSMGEDRALLEMAGLIGQHQSGGSV